MKVNKDTIIYCICSYLNKDIQNMFINTVIRNYKKFFKDLNIAADFKIITNIPETISEQLDDIHHYYVKKGIIEKYSKWLEKEQYKHKLKKHKLKAWNTKFYIIEDFFKSNYKNMLYLDCDLLLIDPQKNINFDSDILSFNTRTNLRRKTLPCIYTEKYIPTININKHIQAGCFFINRKKCFDIDQILNMKNIVSLWEKDSFFLREEIALTYLFYKNNLINKIQKPTLRYKHIGRWASKMRYLEHDKA